ncbi:MAG: universal stress protein [Candidatus Melainabacteria bacterium]|nr:universal stress protein [Candidatus Melainabacteria bacterium]
MSSLTNGRVLLPVDVTHPTKDLTERLEQILPLKGVKAHLLTVREELPSYESLLATVADFPEDLPHTFETKAKKVLNTIAEALLQRGVEVSQEIVSGPAAGMIEKVAKDESFLFTALAPGRHSSVELFFLGSTTLRVAKHCPGMVLVLRNSQDTGALDTVVFGLDGSDNAKKAMIEAIKTFKLGERGVKLVLCSVAFVPTALTFVSPVEFIAAIESNANLAAETILADAEKTACDQGVKQENIELMMRHGDPSNELLQAAKARRAGLLVIGAQGHSGVEHFFLGSVAQRAVMHAPCPVAVVRS